MNYPFWDFPFGNGLLIAVVAGIHVFVSHFAIGGGLYLILNEWLARRSRNQELLAALVPHSRLFLLLTVVLGGITGVGIWFTIGLISPAVTSALIHIFVWGWAIEWVFFFVEIAAALLYYYGWSRLSADTHLKVGIIYFVAAFLSLIVINGIVTFMLTPGDWLQSHDFWDGFFNPTYWPSVLARSGIAVVIAGLFAMLSGARLRKAGFRKQVVRRGSLWVLVGGGLTAPGIYWYIQSLPTSVRDLTGGGVPILDTVLAVALVTGIIVVGFSLLLGLLIPKRLPWVAMLPLLLLGVVSFTALEWGREAARKPYGIRGYMYSSGLTAGQAEGFRERSYTAANIWLAGRPASDSVKIGRRIFQEQCRSCHSVHGYNSLGDKLSTWSRKHLLEILPRLDLLRGHMPPLSGDEIDRRALTSYLTVLASQFRDTTAISAKQAFHQYCGICHTPNKYRPLALSLEGLDEDDLSDIIDELQAFSSEMPRFVGTEAEKRLVIKYIMKFTPQLSEEGN
jgi:mono/diheme cytochrome c family protein